ncbi:MAG: hypothetical protein ACUZ77_10655 [Candidatus Brocadiales bacterium]
MRKTYKYLAGGKWEGSGMGREGIKYAIKEMSEPKLLVLNLS